MIFGLTIYCGWIFKLTFGKKSFVRNGNGRMLLKILRDYVLHSVYPLGLTVDSVLSHFTVDFWNC